MATEDGLYGQSRDNRAVRLEVLQPDEPIHYKPAKFTQCPRCKEQRPVMGSCPHCPEFDKKTCVCGHLAGSHNFVTGWRSGREINVCGGCLSSPSANVLNPGWICNLFAERGASCKLEAKE